MAHAESAGASGRDAERKREAPGQGAWAFLRGMKVRMAADSLSVIAAGVAFYALLAVFPAIAALVALYGLALDPQQVAERLQSVAASLPAEVTELLTTQLQDLAQSDRTSLSLGAAGGVALALWSTSAGVRTLMKALNVAYDQEEERGFFERTGLSLLLTLAAIAGGVVAILAVVLVPAIIDSLGLGPVLRDVVSYARWPIVAATFWLGVLVVYRYGPSRRRADWSRLNRGAVVATVLWLVGSALFSWYVGNFGNYNKTYGSMAAVVILLMWFLLTSYAVLIGAEINAEIERRAQKRLAQAG
ncbi:YihY/virulence factor BrkB family protein [Piscinibacter sp.]|uniref:YihY/virulence factor BrkB family protein n=1 Tax=Piscinibacter sp. TaxID=1903157 RepID=UPI002CE4A3C5|nr:YihY/virulence factor BrkB family protein [Albitalea sp.]HUG21527.1 YihY/virulence factor BrkB family protein [Albitalea sp.]